MIDLSKNLMVSINETINVHVNGYCNAYDEVEWGLN